MKLLTKYFNDLSNFFYFGKLFMKLMSKGAEADGEGYNQYRLTKYQFDNVWIGRGHGKDEHVYFRFVTKSGMDKTFDATIRPKS